MTNDNRGYEPVAAEDPVNNLPVRPAQALWVHFVIDAAVAFVASAVLLWFFGTPFWVMVVVALILGIIATPLTRRWEHDQLEARKHQAH